MTIKRRELLRLAGGAALGASAVTGCATAGAPVANAERQQFKAPAKPPTTKQPNVVILISDDMGWSDVGYHDSVVQTPHIDRLGAEGVKLERFYVFPVCSPTRTAMMTGRSPIRFGIIRPLSGQSDGPPLDERFLPQVFKDAGYQTVMAGKWHLGGAKGYRPRERGFDHFYGFLGGFIDYYKHTATNTDVVDWQRNGETVNEEGYSTELIGQEAVRLIENRDRKKPIFLYVPFNAPHAPAQAPAALIEKYTGAGLQGRRATRAAMIDAMDGAIGKVLAALDQAGLTDDTLAMFFCDNGGGGGGQRPQPGETVRRAPPPQEGMGNAPFRGGKSSAQEGGIRVPAVLRWPAGLKAGGESNQVFTVLDLLPTLAAAAGIPVGNQKPLDGENVWPAIRDGKVVERKGIVIGLSDLAVLDGPWKLRQAGAESELFNLEDDPTETNNLAAARPEIVKKLQAIQEPYAKLIASQPQRGGRPGGGGQARPEGGRPGGGRPGRPGPGAGGAPDRPRPGGRPRPPRERP